ncbi:MAG: very short patch repair endonuclease [Bacteroidales bacterium]|nr:very short patch repair endonuclease [Bacteroidales bacterium]
MTDTMTPAQRHRCMSHIRSKATKPELLVRRWLWGHGYRYRLNVKSVPGKPDIVLRPYRTAIFVNGCFWHGHNVHLLAAQPENHQGAAANFQFPILNSQFQNSPCCKIPQTNRTFWLEKIRRNQERDQRNYRLLQDNGWQVIVVWECQLKPATLEHTMREVELLLNDNLLRMYRKHAPIPFDTEDDAPLPMAAEDGGTQ